MIRSHESQRVRASHLMFTLVWLCCIALPQFGLSADCPEDLFCFQFETPIVLGDLIESDQGDAMQAHDIMMDPFFLGLPFDENIRAGTIVGSADAVVFPAVPLFGISEVRADTRTGARLDANIRGRAGLELNAGLTLGGLVSGDKAASFKYSPTLQVPDEVYSGSFFSMQGAAGDVAGTFDDSHIELPSASVGLDVIFDVHAAGRIDYGLAGVVPYQSEPFNWNIVPQPKDDDGNLTLLGLSVDMNKQGEDEDFGILTVAGEEIGIDLGDNGTVFEYEVSLDAPGASKTDPPLFNRDVGSVQVVRPETGETLFIDTRLDSGQGISYTLDANLVRVGVDIDGIASTLAAGASYTDFSKIIGQADSDIKGVINGTIIDLKYGPELGYKYDTSINAKFDVTLDFGDEEVAVQNPDGSVTLTNEVKGQWENLPPIAVLGTEDVEVDVTFDRYEARRSDRGALTLGDFLEFEALGISANLRIGPLPIELASLGPAIHERTSLLGDLLGEFEIELFNNTDEFLTDTEIAESGTFTIQVADSDTLYLPTAARDLNVPGSWRVLGTDEKPATLAGNTLVFGQGDATATNTSELTPFIYNRTGGNQELTAREALILEGASLSFGQNAITHWKVNRFHNDGSYVADGETQTVIDPLSGVLWIGGKGQTLLSGSTNRIEANILIHEKDHTLILDGTNGTNALDVSQTIRNAGVITVGDLEPMVMVSAPDAFRGIENTGSFIVTGNADLHIPEIVNDGVILVQSLDETAELRVRLYGHGLNSTTGRGELIAGPNGTLLFPGSRHAERHAQYPCLEGWRSAI